MGDRAGYRRLRNRHQGEGNGNSQGNESTKGEGTEMKSRKEDYRHGFDRYNKLK